jgi:3-oxoacyl-[acyl-carrier-protein] synthase II
VTSPFVLTGLGVVSAAGVGVDALAAALAAGRAPSSPVERYRPAPARRSHAAALVPPIASHAHLPAAAARRMSPPSRYAVVAAGDALAEACLGARDGVDLGRGVVLATAFGPSSFTERMLEQILDDPQSASPSLFPECVASAPAAQVGILTRSGGASVTLAAGESGPLAAVARACDLLRAGRASSVLAGAVDEMTPLLHAVLDRFGSLATGAPRPLGAARDGFLAAEGATVTFVEPADAARARGAVPRARIVAWGTAHDPSALPGRWGSRPDLLGRALARGLARADLAQDSIDRIVCGASGSVAGDVIEAAVLHHAFGRAEIPTVLVPKAVTGEYGGAFLAAAVLATGGIELGAVEGAGDSDPALGLVASRGGTLGPARRVLVTTAGAGGSSAWLVLEPA